MAGAARLIVAGGHDHSVLIVINGSIASGKSTIARADARHLTALGIAVAVIDLDLLYDMHHHQSGVKKDDKETWAIARRAAAALTDTFLSEGVRDVVVEGTFFTLAERAVYLDALRTPLAPKVVTLRVGYDEALRRAEADPSRGVSRDPAFLRPYFARVQAEVAAVPVSDLILDTERLTPDEAVAAITDFVGDRD
jgi:chloramphenicol 3-O-phosphotransferase